MLRLMFQNSAHKKNFMEIAAGFYFYGVTFKDNLENYIEKDMVDMIEDVVFCPTFYFQIILTTSSKKNLWKLLSPSHLDFHPEEN